MELLKLKMRQFEGLKLTDLMAERGKIEEIKAEAALARMFR